MAEEEEDDILKRLEELLAEQAGMPVSFRPQPLPEVVVTPEPITEPEPLPPGPTPLEEKRENTPVIDQFQQLQQLGPRPEEELQRLLTPEDVVLPETLREPQGEPDLIPPSEALDRPRERHFEVPKPPPSAIENLILGTTKVIGTAREATEPLRQAVAKPAGIVAALPWMVPAGFEGIRALTNIDAAEREKSRMNAAWLQSQGIGAFTSMHDILGAKVTPSTPIEYGAGVIGGSFVPGARIATGLIAGTTALFDWLHDVPMGTKPKMDFDLATSLLTTPAEAAAAEKRGRGKVPLAKPELEPVPGMDLEPPGIMKKPRMPQPRAADKPGEYEARVKEFEEAKQIWLKQFNPTAKHIMNTVGGYREVKDSDLVGMGIVAVGTAGFVAFPYVAGAMRQGLMPRPMNAAEAAARASQVRMAAPGTISNIGPWDFFRAVGDDINLATVRVARKAMMDPDKVEHLEGLLRTQGFGQAQNMIDNAINLGNLEGNTMRFQTPVPLSEIGKVVANTPQAKEYLIVRDILEEINVIEQDAKHRANQPTREMADELAVGEVSGTYAKAFSAAEKDITVNGLTHEEALEMQKVMEIINPDLPRIGEMWDRWNADRRAFMADGEASTLRRERLDENVPERRDRSQAYLDDQRKSEVPFAGKRDNGMPFQDRVTHTDIIDAMEKRSRAEFGERLKNEIKLYYIDEMRALNLPEGMSYFTKITAEELRNNPRWEPYTVEIWRRGEKEYYTTSKTMVDFMNMDPYVIQSGVGQYMNAAKRIVEFNYTGQGNPVFAFKNALRVWHGAKSMNLNGATPPTIFGMSKSVLEQLYPQMARWMSAEIEAGTGGRAAQFFGSILGHDNAASRTALEHLGRRLAPIYDDSLFHAIEARGGVHGSTLTQQLRNARENQLLRERQLADAETKVQKAGRGVKTFWEGWKSIVGAIHEAPMFDFVSQNMGKGIPLNDLIAMGRNLGGDPKVGGQYYFVNEQGGRPRPLRFESDSKIEESMVKAMRLYGGSMEVARNWVPYGNAIAQSIKRVGTAYLANPVEFTAKVYMYTALPAATQYAWNYASGTDPNGLKYVDYQMNYRPLYEQLTQWYIAIPGSPAEDGLKLSAVALELGFPKVAMEVAMDHMFGQHKLDIRTDMGKYASAALDVSLGIPMLPAIAAWEASQGRIPPMNILGGESIKRSRDPYDQFIGMPESIERYVRVFGGGIGSMFGAAVAAYSHTEEGFLKGIQHATSEAAKTQLRQVPFLPNVLDIGPKIAGSNKITEEFFGRQKTVDKLIQFYQRSDVGRGIINTKAASEQGGAAATEMLGPAIPPITPGPPQPSPTNKLYQMFMGDLYNRFKRDNPGYSKDGQDLGGIGFVSIMRRYGDATRALRTLEHVDDGLHTTWQNWLKEEKNKPLVAELEKNKVDVTNVRQVRNFYERNRQAVALTLYYYVRAVEHEFDQRARTRGYTGPPITLDMIEPYKYSPLEQFMFGFGEAPFAIPEAFQQRFPASEED